MTSKGSPWRPLRERMAEKTDARPLVEGVPDYLQGQLQDWVGSVLQAGRDLADRVVLARRQLWPKPSSPQRYFVFELIGEELLEVVDAILHEQQHVLKQTSSTNPFQYEFREKWIGQVVDLKIMLQRAGSAWDVGQEGAGLERRVDETVVAAAQQAEKTASPSAAEHLAKAWTAIYQRDPDPTRAYSEAIKAVEAASIPHVLPNDTHATLGKVIGKLKGSSWQLAIADKSGAPASADTVIGMMSLLWEGQRDRHAGSSTSFPITQEAAEMAVHLAAALTHWFSSSAIRS